MRYIQKIGTPFEADGIHSTQQFIDDCWIEGKYVNLSYERSRLKELEKVLIHEQSDTGGNSYCCYCMRRLFPDTSGPHYANVTLEHIIPHKISERDWKRDQKEYQKFPCLDEHHIKVCINGTIPEDIRTDRIVDMPYPHFISYHNLAASCDGKIFERRTNHQFVPIRSSCCNNQRQERFVLPFFLAEELSKNINYISDGSLDYDDEVINESWFDNNHLNLNSYWLCLIRKLWYRISQSDYTSSQIETAITDDELRQRIIDDIDTRQEIAHWNKNRDIWILFSEYSWFYDYYRTKTTNIE